MTRIFNTPERSEPVFTKDLAALDRGEIVARRAAFVRDWIASRQRGLKILGAGSLLFLPLLMASSETADAQAAGPIPVGAINGVTGASLNADGSVQLSLSNGQVISIPAAEVTVLADGTLALSAAAAEYVGTLAAVGAAAGVSTAAIAAGGGALAAVAGLAGGGGGDPVPTVTAALSTGRPTLNATELTNPITIQGTAPADALVTVTINGVDQTATADADGAYSIIVPAGTIPAADGPLSISVKAEEVDADGLVVGDPLATSTLDLTVDVTPPELAITAQSFGDNVNIAEAATNQTISGTTDAENGQTVTVTLNGNTYQGLVVGGIWTVTIPAADLAALPEGAPLTVAADVTDAAGNAAPQATVSITADLTAPTIAIDATLAGDNVFTKFNEANGLEVTGTTNAEPGQVVTVTFNGIDYPSTPLTGASWTVTIPNTAFSGLATGDTLGPITARVSDAAGNPSAPASGPTISVNLTGPVLTINQVAGEDVINIAESGADVVISGTATGAENQGVQIRVLPILEGLVAPILDTTSAPVTEGAWSVILPQGVAAGLADGSYRIIANVTDAEGFEATPVNRDFTVDYTRPTVSITGTTSEGSDGAIATDGILNAAEQNQPLIISGTTIGVEDGRFVTLQLGTGGAEVTAEVTDNAWSVRLEADAVQQLVNSVPVGTDIVLTATVSDAAGNAQEAPGILNLVADLTAPIIFLDALPFGAFLNAAEASIAQTISGTAPGAEGQEVTVTITDGTTIVTLTPTADGGGVWTTPFTAAGSALGQGPITVSATVRDAAGNPAAAPATASFTLDTVAPVVTITTVAGDGIINIAEQGTDGITVTGTAGAAESGRTVTVTVNGDTGGTGTVQVDGSWIVEIPAANLLGLGNGDTPSFVASVTDTAGNIGTSAPAPATVDFTRPAVTLDAVATDDIINSFEAGSGFTLSGTTTGVAEGAVVTVAFGGLVLEPTVETGGVWSISLSGVQVAGQITDGADVTITASVTNAIGNPALPASRDVPVDLTAPTVSVNPRPFGTFLNADDVLMDQTISGTTNGAEGANIEIRLFSDGELLFTRSAPTDPVTGDWSVVFTAGELQTLPQGELAINARAVDPAGNVRNLTPSAIVDTIAPVVSIASVQSGGADVGDFINIAERDAGIAVTGGTDLPAGATVTVTLTSGAQTLTATATTAADGGWSATFDGTNGLPTLNEGAVSFAASATDPAGNTGTSAPVNATADFTPPVITIDPVGDEGVVDRSLGALNLTGTTDAEADQTVTVTFQGQTYTGTVVNVDGGPNTWAAEIPSNVINSLATGTAFAASATVSDLAGNAAAAPATADVVTYASAVNYLTEIARSGSEVRLAYFVDPREDLGFEDFALGVQAFFDTEVATYTPRTPRPSLGTQPTYGDGNGDSFGFLPEQEDIDAGEPVFLGVWVGDPVNNVPALFDESEPVVQFSLTLANATAPYTITSQNSAGGGFGPVRHSTLIGSGIDDTLTATNTDTLIRGRGGDDQIDLSAGGVNTVIFEVNPVDNGLDTITGFSVAANTALPDRIGFAGLTNSQLRGDGTVFQSLETGDTLDANAGFVVLTTDIGGTEEANIIAAVTGLNGINTNDVFYLLATDGSDGVLAQVTRTFEGLTVVGRIAEFNGLGDVSSITADQILGFNALS